MSISIGSCAKLARLPTQKIILFSHLRPIPNWLLRRSETVSSPLVSCQQQISALRWTTGEIVVWWMSWIWFFQPLVAAAYSFIFDASTTTEGLCVTTVLIESREKNHLHEIRSKLNVESSDIGSCRERNRGEESALVGWQCGWYSLEVLKPALPPLHEFYTYKFIRHVVWIQFNLK